MGRHVAAECPELDGLVDDACAGVGAAVAAANVPRLAGVVLGGGYGRGEGGVKGTALSNDLDFFAITEDGASGAEIAAIAAALEPISREWTAKLGIDVDFTVRTPWRIRHDERRIMVQELVRGYFDVAGKKGDELFAGVARRPAEDIPWGEAARLMMNRGMGLLLAKFKVESLKLKVDASSDAECRMSPACRPSHDARRADSDFIARNINKCVLGAGDARLVARRGYRWRAVERADALGDELYRAAVEWKFRPCDEPVCDWETARDAWLAALDEIMDAGRKAHALGRSMREAARWVVRRRTLGEPASFGQDCTVRVLRGVARAVRARSQIPPGLRRDWEVFN